MKAKELKQKFVKEEMRDKVGVIAILTGSKILGGDGTIWYHVHDDEKLPEASENVDIALHVREVEG